MRYPVAELITLAAIVDKAPAGAEGTENTTGFIMEHIADHFNPAFLQLCIPVRMDRPFIKTG